jgi:hypothetical protein
MDDVIFKCIDMLEILITSSELRIFMENNKSVSKSLFNESIFIFLEFQMRVSLYLYMFESVSSRRSEYNSR